jgi:hypothetical protein
MEKHAYFQSISISYRIPGKEVIIERERRSISSALFDCLEVPSERTSPPASPEGPHGKRCQSPEPSFIYPSGTPV